MCFITPKIKCKISWNGRELQVRVRRGVKAPLSRISGRVRIIAIKSLQATPKRIARKNPSKPGTPPHTIYNRKKGGHRMRMILYAERRPMEWVVGPKILGTQSKPAPSIHEHGGTKTVVNKRVRKTRRKVTSAQRKAYRKKVRSGAIVTDYKKLQKQNRVQVTQKSVTYPKRPFMNPALQKMIPIIAQNFRNSVK